MAKTPLEGEYGAQKKGAFAPFSQFSSLISLTLKE